MVKYSHLGFGLALGAFLLPLSAFGSETLPVESPFLYNFNYDGVLVESRSVVDSTSPYFWLNSGGNLTIADGIGNVRGESALISRSTWNNLSQEISLRINGTEVDSPYIGAYSGILFLSRYKDDNNYYYTGLRVDGQAVVKKKIDGVFYTMGAAQVYGEMGSYDRESNPNLLPQYEWIKMKSETKNLSSGEVEIVLYVDKLGDGTWTEVLRAKDVSGRFGNSPVINGASHAGVRADFMSVSYEDYKFTEI
jgi:hypothetical protein